MISLPLSGEVGGRHDDVIRVLHEDRQFPAAGRSEDLLEKFESARQNVGRAHV